MGQAIAGHNLYNEEQVAHGGEEISLARYLTSSHFGQAVMENWQSEYLQFTLFLFLTVWRFQRGSPESQPLQDVGIESPQRQKVGGYADKRSPLWARIGGWRTALYSNSLLFVMTLIFVGSWFAQSVTGWTKFNQEERDHGDPTVSWIGYLGSSSFWESTLQNWPSEFHAVGSFVVFTIYLRQRGSPESKPVGAAHDATGIEG